VRYLTILFVTAVCMSFAAEAQVYFNSASANPNNPEGARRDVEQRSAAARKARSKRLLVRCHDGSHHTVRVCGRHGGVGGR